MGLGTILATAVPAVLKVVVSNTDELKKTIDEIGGGITFPNIPVKVSKLDEKFWLTIGEEGGWKVQQNQVTKVVRIVDDQSFQRAWGAEPAMEKLFRKIIK